MYSPVFILQAHHNLYEFHAIAKSVLGEYILYIVSYGEWVSTQVVISNGECNCLQDIIQNIIQGAYQGLKRPLKIDFPIIKVLKSLKLLFIF